MSIKRTCGEALSRVVAKFRWPQRLQFLRGPFVIFGGCLVHLTLGTVYTYGNLAPYLVSYVRERSHPVGLDAGSGAWIFALGLGGQGLSMFLGGLLEKRLGPRLSTLIGCGIMSLGVLLSYLAIKVSFWLLLLTYGVLFGVGVGIAYVGPLACAMRWVPRWKGAMAGLVVAGFGLGALVFTPVQTLYINPDNKSADSKGYFDDDGVLDRVPSVFLLLGGLYIGIQVIGSLLIVDPPDRREDTPLPEEENSRSTSPEQEIQARAGRFFSVENSDYISNHTTSRDKCESLSGDIGSRGTPSADEGSPTRDEGEETTKLIPRDLNVLQDSPTRKKGRENHHGLNARSPRPQSLKTLSKKRDLESSTSSLRSSASSSSQNIVADLTPLQMLKKLNFYILWIMMLLAGFAVVFSATLYKFFGLTFINDDHYLAVVGSAASICNCSGRIVWGIIADKVSYKFSLVVQSGIMSMFLLTFYATSSVGKSTYFIWVCVIFFCVGGVFSLFPTAIARSFGSKYMSVNYGLLFTSQIISGMVAALLFTTLQHLLAWMGLIFLVSAVCLVGFAFTLMFRPKRYVILDLHI